jgi:predicted ArsR family transcriptional regulator
MTKNTEPAPPHVTKTAKLLTLLQTGTGASLEDMTDATGWQPHTVRAAMTGLKKRRAMSSINMSKATRPSGL